MNLSGKSHVHKAIYHSVTYNSKKKLGSAQMSNYQSVVKSLVKRPLRNIMLQLKMMMRDFDGGPVVKNPPCSAGM